MVRRTTGKTLAYSFLIIYSLVFCAIIVSVAGNFLRQRTRQVQLSINEVAADVRSGMVERIVVDGDRLRLFYEDGDERQSFKSPDSSLGEQLVALGVESTMLSPSNVRIDEKPQNIWLDLATWLGYVLPFFILSLPILGVIWYLYRQRSRELS